MNFALDTPSNGRAFVLPGSSDRVASVPDIVNRVMPANTGWIAFATGESKIASFDVMPAGGR